MVSLWVFSVKHHLAEQQTISVPVQWKIEICMHQTLKKHLNTASEEIVSSESSILDNLHESVLVAVAASIDEILAPFRNDIIVITGN